MRTRRPFWLLSVSCRVLVTAYLAALLWRFEILSDTVRDREPGWLGPVIRCETRIADIGKVYYYEGTAICS